MIRKTYRGVPAGTGVAEILTAQGATGADYVASERIHAMLDQVKVYARTRLDDIVIRRAAA